MATTQEILAIRKPESRLPLISPILNRFSPRVFSSEQIPDEHMQIIFEAARLAPSGRNNQPWMYFWARKGSKAYERLVDCIFERNHWCKSAPVLILSTYDPTEPVDGLNRWATYDLGAANLSLILQAQDLGYYARQIGSFDIPKVENTFPEVEKTHKPFVIIAMGKIGNDKDYQGADIETVQKDMIPADRKTSVHKELV